MKRTRRRFTAEFKHEAVRLVRERGVSIAQTARELDVHENLLRTWLRAVEEEAEHPFPGVGQQNPEQAEIARLRREVARLKAVRDIPKKAPRSSRGSRREIRLHCEIPRDVSVEWLCDALGVSRSGFMRGAKRRLHVVRKWMADCSSRCVRVLSRVIAPTACVVCGTTCAMLDIRAAVSALRA